MGITAGSLEGKSVFVTGGSTGVGQASCLAFERAGARAVVSDVNVDDGETTAQEIRDSGGEAVFVQADVSREVETVALVNEVVKAYGRLDCAFHNAGIEGVPGVQE